MVFKNGGRKAKNEEWHFSNGDQTDTVNEYEYLGLTFSCRNSFSSHVTKKIAKCKATLIRQFHALKIGNLPFNTALLWFRTVISTKLTYALEIWWPQVTQTCRQKIDSLQSMFLKKYLQLHTRASTLIIHQLCATNKLSDHIDGAPAVNTSPSTPSHQTEATGTWFCSQANNWWFSS